MEKLQINLKCQMSPCYTITTSYVEFLEMINCENQALHHSRQRQFQLLLQVPPGSLQPGGLSGSHNSPTPKCTQHVVSRHFSVSSSYHHLGFVLPLLPGLQINFFLCSLISSEVSSMVILGEFPSCSLGK